MLGWCFLGLVCRISVFLLNVLWGCFLLGWNVSDYPPVELEEELG